MTPIHSPLNKLLYKPSLRSLDYSSYSGLGFRAAGAWGFRFKSSGSRVAKLGCYAGTDKSCNGNLIKERKLIMLQILQ